MALKRQFEEEKALETAMYLFWEKGFSGTSMENLVTTLGVNRASMYNLFTSKKKLYQLAVQHYAAIKIAEISINFENHQNIRKGLQALFEKLLFEEDKRVKGCFIVNTITEIGYGDKELNSIIGEYEKKVIEHFTTYFKSGVSKGQISPYKDIEVIANYFYRLEQGLQVALKQEPSRRSIMQSVNIALSVLG